MTTVAKELKKLGLARQPGSDLAKYLVTEISSTDNVTNFTQAMSKARKNTAPTCQGQPRQAQALEPGDLTTAQVAAAAQCKGPKPKKHRAGQMHAASVHTGQQQIYQVFDQQRQHPPQPTQQISLNLGTNARGSAQLHEGKSKGKEKGRCRDRKQSLNPQGQQLQQAPQLH